MVPDSGCVTLAIGAFGTGVLLVRTGHPVGAGLCVVLAVNLVLLGWSLHNDEREHWRR